MEKRPFIGVGVYIIKNNKVLLGKRKNAHGPGTWCPPGGHIEFGELIEEAAKRETQEETGITIKNIKRGTYTEDFFKHEKKHYITIAVIADYAGGEVKIMEPEKCEKWEWFGWDKLPQPLFLPVENAIKQGFNPFKS
jgi:8-oxo-dGTP diphosphatase